MKIDKKRRVQRFDQNGESPNFLILEPVFYFYKKQLTSKRRIFSFCGSSSIMHQCSFLKVYHHVHWTLGKLDRLKGCKFWSSAGSTGSAANLTHLKQKNPFVLLLDLLLSLNFNEEKLPLFYFPFSPAEVDWNLQLRGRKTGHNSTDQTLTTSLERQATENRYFTIWFKDQKMNCGLKMFGITSKIYFLCTDVL